MRPYLLTLALVAVVQLQISVMGHAALDHVQPVLPLLVVLCGGFLIGPEVALWWALFMGWLLDWRSGSFAAYSLPLMAVGVLSGIGRRRVFASSKVLPVVFTVLGSLLFLGLQVARASFGGGAALGSPRTLADVALRLVLVNLLWLPVVYVPLRSLAGRLGPQRMGWER
jgi:rod shape-determining protein MreD